MKYWRTSAAPPATAGVEWLGPEEEVYHCWPAGEEMVPPDPPGAPCPFAGGAATCQTPPVIWVPGATISGFLRPSAAGPRDENPMISFALSAPVSPTPEPSTPPNGLTFSEAPTVSTFLPVPGD